MGNMTQCNEGNHESLVAKNAGCVRPVSAGCRVETITNASAAGTESVRSAASATAQAMCGHATGIWLARPVETQWLAPEPATLRNTESATGSLPASENSHPSERPATNSIVLYGEGKFRGRHGVRTVAGRGDCTRTIPTTPDLFSLSGFARFVTGDVTTNRNPPWVWVLRFEVLRQNVDAVLAGAAHAP